MKIKSICNQQIVIFLAVALLAVMVTPAAAQWWRFGTDAGEPVFTDLLFNQISVLNAERRVQFSRDDLENSRVVVRGRAEIGQGAIGRIEASLDAGATWEEIPLSDRGLFAFEFLPELERDYRFRIRALSTTGKASDDLAHAFDFRVVSIDNRAQAMEVFTALIDAYSVRNRSGFMELVSREFVGSDMALDSALTSDFRYFDSIRIRPTIQRMAQYDDRWTIYFNFNRQVRSVRTGQMFHDQASTFLTLIRDGEGFKLYEMAAPLIFGLSDTSNVATLVASDAIGETVIVVDNDGNVSKGEQEPQDEITLPPLDENEPPPAEDNGPPSNIYEGTVSLANQGYSFARRQITAQFDTNSAFAHEGNIIFWGDETLEVKELHGFSSITAVKTLSNDGWIPAISSFPDAAIGKMYALKLINETYAIIRIAGGTAPNNDDWLSPATYQFRHQLNGTPNF